MKGLVDEGTKVSVGSNKKMALREEESYTSLWAGY
jgi:hypothetical protein